MSKPGTVSVVVPVLNAADSIASCIDSLLSQDYQPPPQVIVVDNGSNDQTPEILRDYADRIDVLQQPKPGSSAARNLGAAKASGDYIAFIDADCIACSNWVAELVVPLADPNVGATGGQILSIEPDNPVSLYGETIYDHSIAINQRYPYIITSNCACRRQLLIDLSGLDENLLYGHDVDLGWRIHLRYAEAAVVYHHNRRTLSQLFGQGIEHGFHSVRIRKLHRSYLRQQNSRIFGWQATGLWAFLVSADNKKQAGAFYGVLFGIGKKIGQIIGSLRFGFYGL